MQVVFGNLQIMVSVSQEMLRRLRTVMARAGESVAEQARAPIGEAFQQLLPYLKTFGEYARNYEQATLMHKNALPAFLA